jgi:hypothetical protein
LVNALSLGALVLSRFGLLGIVFAIAVGWTWILAMRHPDNLRIYQRIF